MKQQFTGHQGNVSVWIWLTIPLIKFTQNALFSADEIWCYELLVLWMFWPSVCFRGWQKEIPVSTHNAICSWVYEFNVYVDSNLTLNSCLELKCEYRGVLACLRVGAVYLCSFDHAVNLRWRNCTPRRAVPTPAPAPAPSPTPTPAPAPPPEPARYLYTTYTLFETVILSVVSKFNCFVN